MSSIPFSPDHILLGRRFATKWEAIQAIGEVMLESRSVTARYVEGMIRKENEYSTWLTEGVALPHGTNEVKPEVLRDCVVLVQIPEGVDWGNGRAVHLAIGLASKGDARHLQVLASLAGVLQHEEAVRELKTAASEEEVLQILGFERQ